MFGIQREDVAMYEKITSHGLSVKDAVLMRRENRLPEGLQKAWDEYEKWVMESINGLEGASTRQTP